MRTLVRFTFAIALFLMYNTISGQGVTIADDITNGSSGTFNSWEDSGILTTVGDKIFLYDKDSSPSRLWVSNSTDYTTQMIGEYKRIYNYIEYNNRLYICVRVKSIAKLLEINQDNSVREIYSSIYVLDDFTIFNDILYFSDKNILRKYDKNSDQVTQIHEFYWADGIKDMTATDNNLFIIGGIDGGTALFTSDGTLGGTHDYYTINTGNEFNTKIYMTPVGNKVFFFYNKSGEGYRLWVTDGTVEGTIALTKHDELSFQDLEKNKGIIEFDGKLYYHGDSDQGDCLYVSDGTVSGSKVLVSNEYRAPLYMKVYNNKLYFQAMNEWWNFGWYRTDGNTVEKIFNEYSNIKAPSAEYGDELAFFGYTDSTPVQIFTYNESNEKVSQLTPLSDTDSLSSLKHLTVMGDKVFFICKSPEYGKELFVYDPLLAGNFPTEIRKQPVSLEVCPADTAIFSIKAAGSYIKYQWQKDGIDIVGAISTTLKINNVAPSDNGGYTCIVTGNKGSLTSDVATLTVGGQLSIASQPQDQNKAIGETVTFDITVGGGNIESYQWYKSGVQLEDEGNISGSNTATLQITNLSKTDAGNYKCKVIGKCSEVESEIATLKVAVKTVLSVQPESKTLCEGEEASFNITATGDNLSYQWQKDNTDISGATSNSYTISAITSSDAGEYRCVVIGDGGIVTSDAATLTVKPLISISTQPQSLEINKGKQAVFSVAASGTISTYQWYKDGTVLSDGGKYSGTTTAQLTISDVVQSEAGSYTVKISGECGDITSGAATLSVLTATDDLANAGITIIPNPAYDYIKIINTGQKINKLEIYNIAGIKVLQKSKDFGHIDLSGLETGVYFVKVVRGSEVRVERVVHE